MCRCSDLAVSCLPFPSVKASLCAVVGKSMWGSDTRSEQEWYKLARFEVAIGRALGETPPPQESCTGYVSIESSNSTLNDSDRTCLVSGCEGFFV
jgi:hypothetical protein